MPVARIGRFYEFAEAGSAPALGIESNQLEACVDEAERRRLPGVFGTPAFGFHGTDLDFLSRLPHLTEISFCDVSLENIDGLYALKHLEKFTLHDRKPGVDFAQFPRLRHLTWHSHPQDRHLAELSALRQLDVWRFSPPSRSFADLTVPTGVERLEINWANPASLDGLPRLPALKEIQFHYCRNLTSLDGLERIAPNVQRVVVAASKHCTGLAVLKKLPALQSAFINRKGVAAALGLAEKRPAPTGAA